MHSEVLDNYFDFPNLVSSDAIVTGLEGVLETLDGLGGTVTGTTAIFAQHAVCGALAPVATRKEVSLGFEAESIDIDNVPSDVIVSTEEVKEKLKKAASVFVAVMKKAIAKVKDFFAMIIAKFKDHGKEFTTVKTSLDNKLRSNTYVWKEGEWKVPYAEYLNVNGKADLDSIAAGVINHAENFTRAFALLASLDDNSTDTSFKYHASTVSNIKKQLGCGNYYMEARPGESIEESLKPLIEKRVVFDAKSAVYTTQPKPSSILSLTGRFDNMLRLEKRLNQEHVATNDLNRRLSKYVSDSNTFATKTSGADQLSIQRRWLKHRLTGFGAYRWIILTERLYTRLLAVLKSYDEHMIPASH